MRLGEILGVGECDAEPVPGDAVAEPVLGLQVGGVKDGVRVHVALVLREGVADRLQDTRRVAVWEPVSLGGLAVTV